MKRNKRLIWGGVAVCVFLVYTLCGFFLVPWIIRTQMLKHLPVVLDREVAVGKVRTNPYTLRLEINALDVFGHDGERLVGVGQLVVNLQASSLIHRGLILKTLDLNQPYVRISRDAKGALNIGDLLDRAGQTGGESDPQVKATIPLIRVRQFKVEDGMAVFEDETPVTPYRKEVRSIRFVLNNLSTAPDEAGTFEFGSESEITEAFGWTGSLSIDPLTIAGHVSVNALEIPKFMPYVGHLLDGKVQSGILSADVDYAIKLEERGLDLLLSDGRVTVDSFSLLTHQADESLLSWDRLELAGLEADLLSQTLKVTSLTVSGTGILAHRHSDGLFNFMKAYLPPEVTEELTGAPVDAVAVDPLLGWEFLLETITVSDTSIHLLDESLASPADLEFNLPVIEINNLGSASDRTYNATLQLRNDGPGEMRIEAEGTLFPLAGKLQIRTQGWTFANTVPYLAEYTNISLAEALLEMELAVSYSLAQAGALELVVTGDAGIDSLDIQETVSGETLAKWNRLKLHGVNAEPLKRKLAVEFLELRDPVVTVYMDPEGNASLSKVLKEDITNADTAVAEPEPESESEPESEPLEARIDRLEMSGGKVVFEDRQQKPVVTLSIDEINTTITGLSSDLSARPEFKMESKVMGVTPLSVDGTLNFLIDLPYADVVVGMHGLEMTPFAPYFSRYVGYYLQRGMLNLDLDYLIEEQQLQSSNVVVLNQLTLGQRSESPDATGLPVALAVSLLKDPSGDIHLDMPIEGDLSDPNFRWGGIVMQTLGNLILKLATSPFALLGNLVSASAEDLQMVAFAAGRSELDEAAMANLDALAAALEQRPALSLMISARIDPSVEALALSRKALMQDMQGDQAVDPQDGLTEEERYQSLVKQGFWKRLFNLVTPREQPTFDEMEAELLKNYEVTEEDLMRLANQRKQAVRTYLVGKGTLSPERILIQEDQQLVTVNDGTSRVDLSIR